MTARKAIVVAMGVLVLVQGAAACERPVFAPHSVVARSNANPNMTKPDAAVTKEYYTDEKKFQILSDQLHPLCTDQPDKANSCVADCKTKPKGMLERAKYVEGPEHYMTSAQERAAVRKQKDALEAKWETRK